MLNMPLVHLEYFEDGVTAFVSAQIKPNFQVKDSSLASLNLEEQRKEYIRQINVCAQSLFKNFTLSSLALRYIYVPSAVDEKSQFIIACLLRSDGKDKNQVIQRIRQSWNVYVSAFPHKLYSLIPITDKQEFTAVYQPVDPNEAEIIEIRKFEDVVPTKYVAAGEYYYSVKPISSPYASIEDALKFVGRQKVPLVINICFHPTYLNEEEKYVISQITGELHKFASGFSVGLYGGQTVFEPDVNAEICLRRYISLLENSNSLAQFRVQVISSDRIPNEIVTSVARTLCHNYQLEFADDEEFMEAIGTYLLLDPTSIWGGSFIWNTENSPNSLRRISYIVTPDEILRLFRLPVLFHEQETSTTIVFAERIEHMGDKSFTVHGDVVNSSITANIHKLFGDIEQNVRVSSSLKESDVHHILNLLDEMRNAMEKIPSERASEAEAVAKRAQKLTRELRAERPEKEDLEHHGRLLVRAAENLKQVAPTVLEIARRVVKFVLTLTIL